MGCGVDGTLRVEIATHVANKEWYWRSIRLTGLPRNSSLWRMASIAKQEGWNVSWETDTLTIGAWLPVAGGPAPRGQFTQAAAGNVTVAFASNTVRTWFTYSETFTLGPWQALHERCKDRLSDDSMGFAPDEALRFRVEVKPLEGMWGTEREWTWAVSAEEAKDGVRLEQRALFLSPRETISVLSAAVCVLLLSVLVSRVAKLHPWMRLITLGGEHSVRLVGFLKWGIPIACFMLIGMALEQQSVFHAIVAIGIGAGGLPIAWAHRSIMRIVLDHQLVELRRNLVQVIHELPSDAKEQAAKWEHAVGRKHAWDHAGRTGLDTGLQCPPMLVVGIVSALVAGLVRVPPDPYEAMKEMRRLIGCNSQARGVLTASVLLASVALTVAVACTAALVLGLLGYTNR